MRALTACRRAACLLFSLGLAGLPLACASSGPQAPAFERFSLSHTPSPSDYPDAPAVYLLDRGDLQLGWSAKLKRPIAELRVYRRLKLLRPADARYTRPSLRFRPGSPIEAVRAQRVSPSGEIQAAKALKKRQGPHQSQVYEIDLGDAELGSVIEYSYLQRFEDPRMIAPWVFQRRAPSLRSEYRVTVPQGFEVDLRFTQGGRFVAKRPDRFELDGKTRYSWTELNLPAAFEEAHAPHLALWAPTAHVALLKATPSKALAAKTGMQAAVGFQNWDAFAAWFDARRPSADRLPPALVARAEAIRAKLPERSALALRLASMLRRELKDPPGPPRRLIDSPLRSPAALIAAQNADATERGLLLDALLTALGEKPALGLYAPSDAAVIAPDFVTPEAILGVLVRIDDPRLGPLFIDPSAYSFEPGVAPLRLQGSRVVLLNQGRFELASVPLSPPELSQSQIQVTLALQATGQMRGQLHAKLTGGEAALLREQLIHRPQSEAPEHTAAFLKHRGLVLKLTQLSLSDLTEMDRPLEIEAELEGTWLPDPKAPSVLLNALLSLPNEARLPVRQSPWMQLGPRQSQIQLDLRLPDGWQATPAPPIALSDPSGSDRLSMQSEGPGQLQILAETRWLKSHIDPKDYPEFRRRQQAVAQIQAMPVLVPAENGLF